MTRRKKNGKRIFTLEMKKRLSVGYLLVLLLFAGLAVRLVYINVKKGSEYEQQVLAQQGYTSTAIPYRRGDIIDANGTVLATSKKVYNLVLEPKNILKYDKKKTATISALQEYFELSNSEISEFLSDENSYYKVARKKLEYDVVKPFMDFCKTEEGADVTGVVFEEEYVRVYPNNSLACHLIGFTVSGNVGMYGVEESYGSYLNGYNGREYTYLNNDYDLTTMVESPVNGYNVITSIDANIQSIIEQNVNEYMETEGAKNVSVLVMNPDNCDILALYNSHPFDLNNAYDLDATRYLFDEMTDEEFEAFKKNASDEETVDALNRLWRNFVVSDVFEPGSTYKTFTISGALEEGVVSPQDTFFCDGFEKKDIYTIKCHYYSHGGHGTITLSGALENSCNDALMQIAAKEGSEKFDKYQNLFGFGQRTNVDIPGEPSSAALSSIIYHEDTLNETELATSSFGQGVTVSMMELGTAFCSVINGGYYYEPGVAKRIVDENGNVIENLENILVRRTISESVSEIMRDELFQVVEKGTGRRAAVEGYTIGGKTGTAEKLPRGNGKYLISFIGFAPVDKPQVVVYVVVDEPNVEDQSSSAAASFLFADIAEDLFPYMNIYKTNDNYNLDNSDAEDESTGPIYEGEAPQNDVAGGAGNPYVSGENGQESGSNSSEEQSTEENTEGNTEENTEENTEAAPE